MLNLKVFHKNAVSPAQIDSFQKKMFLKNKHLHMKHRDDECVFKNRLIIRESEIVDSEYSEKYEQYDDGSICIAYSLRKYENSLAS